VVRGEANNFSGLWRVANYDLFINTRLITCL
jgi:hypothetical protein